MVVEDFKENGDTKMAKKIKAEDGKVYVEKKPFYKRVWFIVLAVIVVIGVFASMGGSDDSKEATSKSTTTSKATTTNSSSKASSEETVYSVGQTFTVGDVEYTVNSVSTTQTVGDEFLNETAQGIYLLLNVTMEMMLYQYQMIISRCIKEKQNIHQIQQLVCMLVTIQDFS